MSKEIKNINLAFNCPFTWNELSSTEAGKHCESCKNKVFDFTDKDQKYLEEVLKNNNHVCGRFRKDQLSSGFLKYAASALILSVSVGLNACTQDEKAKACPRPIAEIHESRTMGIIMTPLPKVDDFGELQRKLGQRIRYKKNIPEGKVIVGFEIDTTGEIINPKIMKGLSPRADAMVLKAFKDLGVKLNPREENGIKIKAPYVMPVIFSSHRK